MRQSESLNKFLLAFAQFQYELKPIKHNQDNPFYHSKYADLVQLIENIKELLKKYGFCLIQNLDYIFLPETQLNQLCVITRLYHVESNQWIESIFPIISIKNDAQAFGSATTYAKRYSIAAICGIVTEGEDDDGNSASNKKNGQSNKSSQSTGKSQSSASNIPANTSNKDSASQIKYIVEKVMEMTNQDEELAADMLKTITSYDYQDRNTGKQVHFNGLSSFKALAEKSIAMIATTYGKVKNKYEKDYLPHMQKIAEEDPIPFLD